MKCLSEFLMTTMTHVSTDSKWTEHHGCVYGGSGGSGGSGLNTGTAKERHVQ